MREILNQAGQSLGIQPALLAQWEKRGDIRVSSIAAGWTLVVHRMESAAASAIASAKANSEPGGTLH